MDYLKETQLKERFDTDLERPWGGYVKFTDNERATVKILIIKPGKRLSLQYHKHREELWYIVSGKVKVHKGPVRPTLDETKRSLKEHVMVNGDFIDVLKLQAHRIENIGKKDAKILEVSRGDFNEYDEIRLEDDYGRTSPTPQPSS